MTFGQLLLHDLSDAERRALRAYKSAAEQDGKGATCFDMNRMLEHGLRLPEMAEHGHTALTLDGIFVRAPRTTSSLTLYRAVCLRRHLPLHEIGAKFRNRAFWSTSLMEEATYRFLATPDDGSLGAILQLKVPAGMAAYDLETLEGAGGSEKEILLPRDLLWKVNACKAISNTVAGAAAARYSSIVACELSFVPSW